MSTAPDTMAVIGRLANRIAQLEVDNAVLSVSLEQAEEENEQHRTALMGATPAAMPQFGSGVTPVEMPQVGTPDGLTPVPMPSM